MIVAINYADNNFKKAQRLNTKSAYHWGADRVIEYGPEDISEDFKERNRDIWEQKRGGGYWIWKSYILQDAISRVNDGDIVIYVDSGAAYINKISYLIEAMNRNNDDIMLFQINTIEKHWTKRDAFVLLDCDSAEYTDSRQTAGGYIVIRKTQKTVSFLEQYSQYAQDERLITDKENVMGLPNYDGFREHRHDQSIMSLLVKKNYIVPYRDPSQYGINEQYSEEIVAKSTYPQIIDSHRRKDITSSYVIYCWIKKSEFNRRIYEKMIRIWRRFMKTNG